MPNSPTISSPHHLVAIPKFVARAAKLLVSVPAGLHLPRVDVRRASWWKAHTTKATRAMASWEASNCEGKWHAHILHAWQLLHGSIEWSAQTFK